MIFKKKHSSESSKTNPAFEADKTRKPVVTEDRIVRESEGNEDSTQALIASLLSNGHDEINPYIDFNEGKIKYPTLENIGCKNVDTDFLENSVKKGFLEKTVYERFLVCPDHPQNISANMRIYCPVCSSPNIGRLQLFEHKVCGHITESKHFECETEALQCPSCKKIVQKPEKELRMPAKWYQCFECSNRFDNALIKLHCRQFDHDFDPNSAKLLVVHNYKITNKTSNPDISRIVEQTKKLLTGIDLKVDTHHVIRTEKGRNYVVDIFCENSKKQTAFVFLDVCQETFDDRYLDSIIVSVLDLSPNVAILVSDKASEDAKKRAECYDIVIIDSNEIPETSKRIAITIQDSLGDSRDGS